MLSLDYLARLRSYEIDRVAPLFTPGQHILEIGAGTGTQALELSRRGFRVTAIELADSSYAADRAYPILDYDGRTIPLPDASVDAVFSSNVLEHVPDLSRMHAEIRRVLRPGGYGVHLMPTPSWRFWTTLTCYPEAVVYLVRALPRLVPRAWPRRAELRRLRAVWRDAIHYVGGRLLPLRHGERGNVVSELWLFHPLWWRRNFSDNRFAVDEDEPIGLFYTGNAFFGERISIARRELLARILGSACHIFKVVPR
jgi:SAM-dependent methyltransferase